MHARYLFVVVACLLSLLAGTAAAQPDGPDIRVGYGTVIATAADYEMDGTMWVAIACLDSGNYIYRSTDHGLTWPCLQGFNAGFAVDRLGLVVGEGDSNFIHVFVNYPSQEGDLYDIRFNRDGSSGGMFSVADGPDTIRDFAVCRDYSGDNYWLYAVATNPDSLVGYRALRFFRSSTYGREWYLTDSCPGEGWSEPHISAGAGSYIYFTALNSYGTTNVLNLWLNSLWMNAGHWLFCGWPQGTDDLADPVVGAAFTKPESLATIWCLWAQDYNNSGDWDVKYVLWSGDSGWSDPAYLAGTVAADEQFPDLRNYTSLGNPYINASYISDDNVFRTVYRRYAQASTPTQWSDTLRINDGNAGTGSEVRPKLCYTPGGPFSGAGCVFTGAGLNGCWWNGPYPIVIAEPRTPQAAAATLSVRPGIGRGPFHIRTTSPASVSVHDPAGRLVRELALERDGAATWDGLDARGHNLAGGVYFVRLVAEGRRATEKLVLQR